MNLRVYTLIALIAGVVGVTENLLWGSDQIGTLQHQISVGFFLLTIVAVIALIVLGALALTRRLRSRATPR